MADAAGSSQRQGRREVVEDLLGRLHIQEEEGDNFVWEEEVTEPPTAVKWLAIAKVHTTTGFSPSALYANMRSTWNPT